MKAWSTVLTCQYSILTVFPQVTDVRLPTHLLPEKYKVELVPFLIPDNFTIRGHVEITMTATVDGATNVTLHVNDMKLENDTISLKEMDSGEQVLNDVTNKLNG